MELTKEQCINIYKKMLQIRKFEETIVDLFQRGMIQGSTHVYLGEEAIAVGACQALTENDFIISTHRGHGHCIAKGGNLKKMMAEIFGKKTGYCKGKGGSMHIADFEKGILGANGIVGGGIPIAVGSGMASRINEDKKVTLCFFGDGASNQGSFHESLNMAAVFNLPVVFICENNQYAVSTPAKKSTSVKNISRRSNAYNIPGYTIDGNNVEEVYNTVMKAVKMARNGEGPSLIECKTLRWHGHYVGDPQAYRDKKEIDKGKKENDPIKLFKDKLKQENILTLLELEEIENSVREQIEAAFEFAQNSPEPDEEELWKDIYVN